MIRPALLAAGLAMLLLVTTVQAEEPAAQAIRPLAQDFVTVFESPEPAGVHCYTPGICRLDSGRLIVTFDLGGKGAHKLPEPRADVCTERGSWQGHIMSSDDGGLTWQPRAKFPGMHARPFVAGKSLYVIGHTTDLFVLRSDDGGDTWSAPAFLTEGQQWHQTAANVHYARDCVYLVMERRVANEIQGWYVGELAPVLMRGKLDADLTRRENWAFASELPFAKAVPPDDAQLGELFGVPFYKAPWPAGEATFGRKCAPLGWLEANVVQINDPDHVWFDPAGRTFHLWMRAHTGGTGYAAIAKVVEDEAGQMTTMLERVPSGKEVLWLPCPGGQMRFHVLYDEPTKLYWLLSSQATDSMTRSDRLSSDRFGLPNNERHRLQLHFSKNMVDWCFAGLVANGESPRQARHYAGMCTDGDDLLIVSRSGDERAKSAHDGNLVTFHRVRGFRGLVY